MSIIFLKKICGLKKGKCNSWLNVCTYLSKVNWWPILKPIVQGMWYENAWI
jgi:hypothetical protein